MTPLAQHLYFTILKTLVFLFFFLNFFYSISYLKISLCSSLNEVEWDGKNIVVMKSVIINPPYSVTSCHSRNGDNNQAVEHVKKIVIHFIFLYLNS